jgi:hypothetical protein
MPIEALKDVSNRISKYCAWFQEISGNLPSRNSDCKFNITSGTKMIELLEQGPILNKEDYKKAIANLKEIETWTENLLSDTTNLTNFQMQFLIWFKQNSLILENYTEYLRVLGYIYKENGKNIADFRLLIEQKISEEHKHIRPLAQNEDERKKNTKLSLLCLNAGIIFQEINQLCSSLVLTSGK